MDSDNLVLTGWSYGLAALAYAVLSIALLQRGYGKAPREPARLAMLVAALASVALGQLLLVFLFTGQLAAVLAAPGRSGRRRCATAPGSRSCWSCCSSAGAAAPPRWAWAG